MAPGATSWPSPIPGPDDLDARDLEIIERHADELNKEAAEALEYQVPQ